MKNITHITSAVALVASLALISLFAFRYPEPAEAVGSMATHIDTATTTGAVSVTTSARILATTTNPLGTPGVTSFTRVYATICNPNANPVVIALDGDQGASLANATYVIAAAAGYNACYEITDRNQYNGSIRASSTAETATTIFVADYVQ